MTTTETAEEIITAGQEHLRTLIGRKWPEISRIIDKDGEITIAAKIAVTAREPEPGKHADKDNRVKTTISFAEKFSDSTESALEDPSQPELPLATKIAATDVTEQFTDGEEVDTELTQEEMDDAAAQAEAEQGTEGLPKIAFLANELTLADANRFAKEFKRAAKAAEWPQEKIDIMRNTLAQFDSIVEMQECLKPYIAAPEVAA